MTKPENAIEFMPVQITEPSTISFMQIEAHTLDGASLTHEFFDGKVIPEVGSLLVLKLVANEGGKITMQLQPLP
ncbi:hypothetical protein G8E10_09535 [Rhizobiaceae bacterium CRRU44]|uniref:Uncharacterized protein n=1 Tax=Ferranicluibacter rubi TaxID=2715133 RepID=A0AA44CA98_9HYPH|nr:hypothetical protein [Ferranicluibacter rubi]NHT75920.1 hypothetical protein [Ferranicluibacter rubi]NHT75980.1 hypothetical protein [Ferranicluibacter rubi]